MQHPLLDSFPLAHPKVRAAERTFGVGRFSRFPYQPSGPLGNCYWNVADAIRAHGGSAVYGWQILFWPGLYVTALHHGLWRRPDGIIVDVTEKYPTDRRAKTTFCPDDSEVISLNRPVFLPSKYFPLSNAAEVSDLIALSRVRLDHRRSTINSMIDRGAIWAGAKGLTWPPGLLESFKMELDLMRIHERQMGTAFDACARISQRNLTR